MPICTFAHHLRPARPLTFTSNHESHRFLAHASCRRDQIRDQRSRDWRSTQNVHHHSPLTLGKQNNRSSSCCHLSTMSTEGTSLTVELISGGVAGVFGTILGFPFDTVKTRMQTRPDKFPTLLHSFRRIYREEGVLQGFYRGVASPLLALTVLNMMNFSVYGKVSEKLCLRKDDASKSLRQPFEPRVFLAGSASGVVASLVSTPFEHVKIQMQMSNLNSENSRRIMQRNTIETACEIVAKGNIPLLYRGHGVNTMREICFLGTYFFVYEHNKTFFNSYLPGSLSIPLSGGISGSIGWFVSFPLDAIKSNIQGVSLSSPKQPAFAVARRLIATKGIIALYSGVHASVSRAFLVSSSRFTAYELTQYLLKNANNS